MNFADFSLQADLSEQLQMLGYETPSFAQEQAIPRLLNSESVVVMAPQGSGASEIALIIALHKLTETANALVVVPDVHAATRLSRQLRTIGKNKTDSVILDEGVVAAPVMFATPAVAAKAMQDNAVNADQLTLVAMVNTDALASAEDCKAIAAAMPDGCQSYLTACHETETTQQIFAAVQGNTIRIDCPSENRPANAVPHQVWPVGSDLKRRFMVHFLKRNGPQRTLVYVEDKTAGSHLARRLRARKFVAKTLFKQQNKNQSGDVLQELMDGKLQVIVTNQLVLENDTATFDYIINYDVPTTSADYQKRLEAAGNATIVSLVAPSEEEDLLNIEFEVGRPLQRFESPDFDYTSTAPATPVKEEKPSRRRGRDRDRDRDRDDDHYGNEGRTGRSGRRGRKKEYVWDPEIPKSWGDRNAMREDPPKTPLEEWEPTPMPEFWFVDGEYTPSTFPPKQTKYPGIKQSEKKGKSNRRRRRGKGQGAKAQQGQGQQQKQQPRKQGQPNKQGGQQRKGNNNAQSRNKANANNNQMQDAGNKPKRNNRRRRRRGGNKNKSNNNS